MGRRSDHPTFTYSPADGLAIGGFVVLDTFVDVLFGISDTHHYGATQDGRDAEKLCQYHDTRIETSRSNLEDVYCLPQ